MLVDVTPKILDVFYVGGKNRRTLGVCRRHA